MLRILLTNTQIAHRTGSELYIRDVAVTLQKRGHLPIVYSSRLGELAESLKREGVLVTDDLDTLALPPDVIHGQHHLETMTAVLRFPGVPAVFFRHGWQPWVEKPPKHPRIRHYVVVSERMRDRLLYEHAIPPEQITLLLNFVDLNRFPARDFATRPLPERPAHALLMSNHASPSNSHDFSNRVREACAKHAITLDVIGLKAGNATEQPEEVLGQYDLVFGRGRVALEAMASGTAVILCDVDGIGTLVTPENLMHWRVRNFAGSGLELPITVEKISDQIARYRVDAAMAVSATIRQQADMESVVTQIVGLYEQVITQQRASKAFNSAVDEGAEHHANYEYVRWLSTGLGFQLYEQIDLLDVQNHRLANERDAADTQLATTEQRANEADARADALTMELAALQQAQNAREASVGYMAYGLVRAFYRSAVPLKARLWLKRAVQRT